MRLLVSQSAKMSSSGTASKATIVNVVTQTSAKDLKKVTRLSFDSLLKRQNDETNHGSSSRQQSVLKSGTISSSDSSASERSSLLNGNSNQLSRSLMSSADSTSFQNACKARLLKKQKEALAESNAIVAAIRATSAKESRDATSKRQATTQEKDRLHRRRAEVYAINAYLQKLETSRYEEFKKKQEQLLDASDDISWCSADSSVMPTPRYRAQDGKKGGGNSTPGKMGAVSGGV
jgi:hypothetical protein